MRTSILLTAIAWLASIASAFPNAAAILRASGVQLSDNDIRNFDAVSEDATNAEKLFNDYQALRRRHEKRDPSASANGLKLPLGGGLKNGKLQPFTGILSGLPVPVPQPFGLKKIPGDDPRHQFRKPGKTDVRGMCPTLNALANHGYISRTGISSFAEVANACQTGFGLGYDVSTFLSAFGLLAGGDLLSGKYSIGGQDNRVPNTLGLAPGLDSHGVFEIDTSITRQDTHWGNNANFLIDRWLGYVGLAKKHGGQFGFDMNVESASNHDDRSREYNPAFLAGFIWLFVTHVERVFVFALLPNGTDQSNTNYKNIAPFFLDERFPPDWFRRATPWTAPQNFGTAFEMFFAAPRELGANVGKGNFVSLNANITNATPEDLTCFIMMNWLDLAPAQLQQPAFAKHPDVFRAFLKGAVWPFFVNDGHYNCPVSDFTGPSQSAGEKGGDYSASGSPVNGKYEALGYIKPDGLLLQLEL